MGYDVEYVPVKRHGAELCTCPNCHFVWGHYEDQKTLTYDQEIRWVKTRYLRYQCPECKQWSALVDKPTFWQKMRGKWRENISGPEDTLSTQMLEQEER